MSAALRFDLVLVVDCTTGMEVYMDKCKEFVVIFAECLKRFHPYIHFRVSWIGYHDHNDSNYFVDFLPFTADIFGRFAHFVKNEVKCTGGLEDKCEDVMGGLNTALNLQFNNYDGDNRGIRILLHVADAPCHGNAFHASNVPDAYPSGCPLGLLPENIIPRLIFEKDVQYIFIKLNYTTDLMIKDFNRIIELYQPQSQADVDCPNGSIAATVKHIRTVPVSIASRFTSTVYRYFEELLREKLQKSWTLRDYSCNTSLLNASAATLKDVPVNTEYNPRWDRTSSSRCLKYHALPITTIDQLLTTARLDRLSEDRYGMRGLNPIDAGATSKLVVKFKIAPQQSPFYGKGTSCKMHKALGKQYEPSMHMPNSVPYEDWLLREIVVDYQPKKIDYSKLSSIYDESVAHIESIPDSVLTVATLKEQYISRVMCQSTARFLAAKFNELVDKKYREQKVELAGGGHNGRAMRIPTVEFCDVSLIEFNMENEGSGGASVGSGIFSFGKKNMGAVNPLQSNVALKEADIVPGNSYRIQEEIIHVNTHKVSKNTDPGIKIFDRYNSNAGYVAPSPTLSCHHTHHESVQAFCHWTHVATKHCMMVVNCKGFYNKRLNSFVLTGPSIHTAPSVHAEDGNTLRSTYSYNGCGMNHGELGFRNFYKTHVCNEICHILGLNHDVYVPTAESVAEEECKSNAENELKCKEEVLTKIFGGRGDAFHILNNTEYF